jgi:hypothetical protein
MSSDIYSVRRITILLKRGTALIASPCAISHIFMVAGSSNVCPTVCGFLFLAIKYEISKEAKVLLWK